MGQFTLLEFLLMSIPEEFLMAFFAWAILGKKDSTKFVSVVITGLITACAFGIIQILLYPYVNLAAVIQLLVFTLILYFTYRLIFAEAIIGALLTMVVLTMIQAVVTNIGFMITPYNFQDLSENIILKVVFFIPVFTIFCLVSLILYKYNIKLLNFKKKKTSAYYFNKVRYVVLQLILTFFIIIFNFGLYFFNKSVSVTNNDKVLIIMNLCIVVLFTVLIVRSAFKMGESIQQEEEQKREFDGREIVQNIDYMCKLMDLKKYEEVNNILNSMKSEVNMGLRDKISSNRGDSIK